MTDVPFKVVQDDDPICEFIIDYIKSANQINTNTKKRKYQKIEPIDETEEVAEETKTEEKETELLDMISIDCWDDFNIWKKLLWAMKNEGYMKSMGRKYSMLSASFDEEAFNRTWDKSPSSITLTQGTINYYAKQSNESKYCEYINKSIFNNKKKLDFVENRTDFLMTLFIQRATNYMFVINHSGEKTMEW